MAKRKVRSERAECAALWAGLTHDLRQPIQAALLLTDLAGRARDATVLTATYGHLEHQLLDIQEMVEATGVLSRLEAGLMVARRDMILLSALVHEAGTALNGRSGCDAAAELEGDDLMIEGDRALLMTAFCGLVRLAVLKQTGAKLRVSGKLTEAGVNVLLGFEGAPFNARERSVFFISQTGQARERAALGFAYLERLLAAMGFDLTAESDPQNRQWLTVSTAAGQKIGLP